jgi:hypothetical protein
MRLSIFGGLARLLLLANGISPARANLVTDPGFESCGNFGDTAVVRRFAETNN